MPLPLLSNHSQRVANIKTKNANTAVSLLQSFFLLALSFADVTFELIERKKPAILGLFHSMTANFVRFVFKKSAKDSTPKESCSS